MNEGMNEWMNEGMNEWIDVWINELMNESMKAWKHERMKESIKNLFKNSINQLIGFLWQVSSLSMRSWWISWTNSMLETLTKQNSGFSKNNFADFLKLVSSIFCSNND